MPSVTSTLSEDGPVVDVKFILSSELEKKFIEEKKTPPQPISARALIDTGASHCIIKEDIPKQLGLEPVGAVKINTPSTKEHLCYQYFLRILFPSHNLIYEGVFTAAPLEGQNIQCLIGRDVLKDSILIYIGNMKQFTLSIL